MRQDAAGVMLILALASCGRPKLEPQVLNGPLPTPELVARAEVILIGKIESITFGEPQRENVPRFPDLNDCLVPVRVEVGVENVFRGSTPAHIGYYYFGSNCGTMGPVESPHIGDRSVFFLRKHQGRWRVLADYWRNRIPVYTGKHDSASLVGQAVESAISEALLTPGEGSSGRSLVAAVALSTPEATVLTTPMATGTLLRRLLQYPDTHVQVRACLELMVMAETSRSETCANRIATEGLDHIERRGLGTASPGLALDLQQLAKYAGPATLARAQHLLPFVETRATAPPPPLPPIPHALR